MESAERSANGSNVPIHHDRSILRLVQLALAEDVGLGDISSEALVSSSEIATAEIVARESGTVGGTPVAGLVFGEIDMGVACDWIIGEGEQVEPGTVVGRMHGAARSILTAERTALNFLQRISGVATMTRQYVDAVAGTDAVILDTRKTIPGWRLLDKYAVTVGGGRNHRMGLHDMVMIKDNHIAAYGSIHKAVAVLRAYMEERGLDVPVEVETSDLDQVSEALSCQGVSRIMFDNFSLDMLGRGVVLVDGRCETEASGGINLSTVRDVAETGVQFISVGALTHSAPALDLALEFH